MKNLDEIGALAQRQKSPHFDCAPDYLCETCLLARAVLELLPVVEAAIAQEQAGSDGRCTMRILAKYELAIDATNQAVAAFRAANREGETKAT